MPSEFLKLSADELQFNILVANIGTTEEKRQAEKARKQKRMYGK